MSALARNSQTTPNCVLVVQTGVALSPKKKSRKEKDVSESRLIRVGWLCSSSRRRSNRWRPARGARLAVKIGTLVRSALTPSPPSRCSIASRATRSCCQAITARVRGLHQRPAHRGPPRVAATALLLGSHLSWRRGLLRHAAGQRGHRRRRSTHRRGGCGCYRWAQCRLRGGARVSQLGRPRCRVSALLLAGRATDYRAQAAALRGAYR